MDMVIAMEHIPHMVAGITKPDFLVWKDFESTSKWSL